VTGEGTYTWSLGGLLDQKTTDAIKVDCSNNLTREDKDRQKVSGTQWEKDLWSVILPVSDAADIEREAARKAEGEAEMPEGEAEMAEEEAAMAEADMSVAGNLNNTAHQG
jgi:hypothetical protein